MQLFIKRFLDILVSLILLILILPLWVILVVIIETTSPGRAIFMQKEPDFMAGLLFATNSEPCI